MTLETTLTDVVGRRTGARFASRPSAGSRRGKVLLRAACDRGELMSACKAPRRGPTLASAGG